MSRGRTASWYGPVCVAGLGWSIFDEVRAIAFFAISTTRGLREYQEQADAVPRHVESGIRFCGSEICGARRFPDYSLLHPSRSV